MQTNLQVVFFRYVYGMGMKDTRVKDKKGKTILVITHEVRDLINGLENFEKMLEEQGIEV